MNRATLASWAGLLTPLLLTVLIIGVASASSVATPHAFVSNTRALAADVNENFAAHQGAINDNATRTEGLEAALTASNARIAELEATVVTSDLGPMQLYGAFVDPDGTVLSSPQDGISVERLAEGRYTVRIAFPSGYTAANPPAAPLPVITTLPGGEPRHDVFIGSLTLSTDLANLENVWEIWMLDTATSALTDTYFTFLLLGTR